MVLQELLGSPTSSQPAGSTSAKKSRGADGEPNGPGAAAFVTRGDLEDLMEQMASGLRDDVKNQFESLSGGLASTVEKLVTAAAVTIESAATSRTSTLFRAYDAQLQERFKEHEESLADIKEMQERAQTEAAAMAVRIATLEKLVAVSEQVAAGAAIPAVLATQQWKRNADPTIIILTTPLLVAKSAVEDAVCDWLAQTATKQQFRIEGAAMSKRFVVRFLGEPLAAGRRCKMSFESLRNADGSWVDLKVDGPAGAKISLYTSADKNKHQACTERFGKVLQKALATTLGKEVHLLKRDGTCTIAWDPVAKVDPQEDGSCRLMFLGEAMAKHNIDKEAVKQKFAELSAARPLSSLQWSI